MAWRGSTSSSRPSERTPSSVGSACSRRRRPVVLGSLRPRSSISWSARCSAAPRPPRPAAIDDAEWIRVQAAIRPSVHVTVPVLSLLGADVTPAELDGYGPIDQDTAARLAAQAPSFTRILTHPETGAFLSYGRNSYRVPSDLAGYLRVRDGTCRFPGCTVAAWRTELDHTSGWAEGGATSAENLACLCPKHPRLKHRGGWRVRQVGGASLEWTSPSGREYRTEPERALIGGAQGVEEAMHRARTGHRSA